MLICASLWVFVSVSLSVLVRVRQLYVCMQTCVCKHSHVQTHVFIQVCLGAFGLGLRVRAIVRLNRTWVSKIA